MTTPVVEMAILCLAFNVYFEARGEPPLGQYAVAQVTLNRAQRDPSRVCDEVFKPHQFEWTAGKPEIRDKEAFKRALDVARESYYARDFTGGATHFHSGPRPYWAKTMQSLGQIGSHFLYKEKQ